MARLFLVRHAKPAAAWGEDPDPGLDAIGAEQALGTARSLQSQVSPLSIYSSPLRRCQETAAPLEDLWQSKSRILTEVAEIPAPPLPPAARREWLTRVMGGTWRQLQETAPAGAADYLTWRRTLLEALGALTPDAVIYSHFIAINAVVGAARGCDDVVCFRPDHASITIVEFAGGRPRIVELGREADTAVLTRN